MMLLNCMQPLNLETLQTRITSLSFLKGAITTVLQREQKLMSVSVVPRPWS
jgi:hypothetical protein